ncbi:unnamed protein product, partial [Lampetra planeri]
SQLPSLRATFVIVRTPLQCHRPRETHASGLFARLRNVRISRLPNERECSSRRRAAPPDEPRRLAAHPRQGA